MPETVSAVELAYGNWEAVVEVAKKKAAVGPLVAVSVVASVHAVSMPVVPPVTLAPPPPTQVPLMEKHPERRSKPLAAVEVAFAPVRFKYEAASAPENVEVELVPRTFRKPWMVEVPVVLPCSVVVAAVPDVLPIHVEPKTERLVLDAPPWNCWSPVHEFAVEKSKPMTPVDEL